MDQGPVPGMPQAGVPGGGDVPTEAIREELTRVLNSHEFRTSKRSQDFLRYVVENTLQGHIELLKERGYRFIEIDYSERDTLAVNVLSLGAGRLAAIEENQKTNQRLRDAGFQLHTFAGSEICINGAGGPTCLTRPLLRA